MLMIPFPFVIAEIVIFFTAVNYWGFWQTFGYYLLPCLLGMLIISTVGRMALMTLQGTVAKGQLPGKRILHSGAIFLSGLLFLVPSFFTRIFAVSLLLPGTRHFLLWRFKLFAAQKMAQGSARTFNFGSFGSFGNAGFKYYEYKSAGGDFEQPPEREVKTAEVLDIQPLKVIHEDKKSEDN